jgi:uncharacterized damage-inducible protein DinB
MSTSPAPVPNTEPWLRGTHAEVPSAGRAVLHALDLALDDLTRWTTGLTDAEIEAAFSNAAERVRVLATADLDIHRGVGRKQLPTSIGGALIHVADHTQRHVGQVVTTAKVLKALRS